MGRGLGRSEEVQWDEPMWVIICKCMEAMLGIFLCIYLYLKLVKMLCLSYIFSSTKLEKKAEQDLSGTEGVGGKCVTGGQGVKYGPNHL
jgi:hypothetical protein